MRLHHRSGAGLACLTIVMAGVSPVSAQSPPLRVVDDLGRELEFSAPPGRVVSLVPVVTEILFALEAEDLLVGRSAYDDYPPEVTVLPSVGDAIRPSAELLVQREPDLVVLVAGSDNSAAVEELERLGVVTLAVVINTLPDLRRNMLRLGAVSGKEAEARHLWSEIQQELEEVASRVRELPRRSVYYDVAYPPIITIGGGSYLDTLISIAGGSNVFGELAAPSPQVSLEVLAARDPDIIVHPLATTSAATLPPSRRPGWHVVRAVADGAIVTVNGDLVHRLGPRVGKAALELARALHPDAFPDAAEERLR